MTPSDDSAAPQRHYAEHLEILAARIAQALETGGYDSLCVFAGAELAVARDDQTYPFRAEPYFLQAAPLGNVPGSVIEFAPGDRPRLCYFQSRDFWHEPAADPSGFWSPFFDITVASSAAEVRSWLRTARARRAAIGDTGEFAAMFAAVNDHRLLSALDFDRARKTPFERACMRAANTLAVLGHAAVADRCAEPVSEFELHQAYCSATGQRETELPYPNIIALNEHAAVLHYQKLRPARPYRMDSLLIDAGARHFGYAADVTRTYANADSAFGQLIASMESLQRKLCAQVRAGVDFVDLNDTAHRLLSEVLVEHELVLCDAETAYESGLTTTFLPHGLGHLLGLQVHDAGGRQISPDGEQRAPPDGHPHLRLTRKLSEGFVVTIEPGLYFIPSLLERVPSNLKRFLSGKAIDRMLPCGGIRIEDNLLVESHGSSNLTRNAFDAMSRSATSAD